MTFFVLIILAITQGITEFLPISSSGHLLIVFKLFNIDNNVLLISIIFHIASLISILIYYRKTLFTLIKNPLCKTNFSILLTIITTCILVLIFKPFIDYIYSGNYLIICFIFTAILLIISSFKKNHLPSFDITNLNISLKKSIIIGIGQFIACVPGISRSGTTISTSILLGINNSDANNYSFLIAIPIILASLLMEILDIIKYGIIINFNIIELIIAFVLCVIIGIFALKLVNKWILKNKFYYFSIYLLILSLMLLIFGI